MLPNHTPTVLVALSLTPDQFDLLEEIQAEAVDILDTDPKTPSGHDPIGGLVLYLDRNNIRLSIGWSESDIGNILALAIGERPDHSLSDEETRAAACMLRELVNRAEALFEVIQSYWQITPLPVTVITMERHAARWNGSGVSPHEASFEDFYIFQPDERHGLGEIANPASENDFLTSMHKALKQENEDPSWAMQATALTLSTACAVAVPPVGIAMFTYAVLRQGTDMNLFQIKSIEPRWTQIGGF